MNASTGQVYLCSTLPSVNDYISHLQDKATVELDVKLFYELCQLRIITLLPQQQHNN